MFAGKTTETLKRILWAKNGRGQDIRVYKPAFDQRYSKLQIVSHEGLAADAEALTHWNDRTKQLIDDARDHRDAAERHVKLVDGATDHGH